jgi:REP element-mobilizing transposase RayT
MKHRLYLHFVWTTRDREPLIDGKVAEFLQRFLKGVARQERAEVIECGLVRTHVHVLAQLHSTTSIPRLLQRWKGGSATLAGKEGVTRPLGLRWAKWYSMTSVSPRQLDSVATYVRNQPLHHPADAIPGWLGERNAASAADAEPRL